MAVGPGSVPGADDGGIAVVDATIRFIGHVLLGLLTLVGVVLSVVAVAGVYATEGWWGIGGLVFILICVGAIARHVVEG
jgi:hypothetical protein